MFIPAKPLVFKDARLLLFKSTKRATGPARMAKYPMAIAFFSLYKIGYNVYDSHKLRALTWLIPLILATMTRTNIINNATTMVEEIYLQENGNMIEIVNTWGQTKAFDIKMIRIMTP